MILLLTGTVFAYCADVPKTEKRLLKKHKEQTQRASKRYNIHKLAPKGAAISNNSYSWAKQKYQ
jgi:hypothetical protein